MMEIKTFVEVSTGCKQGLEGGLYLSCTANPSKFTEKCFLDLRNLFSNQENIRIFFSKQEK